MFRTRASEVMTLIFAEQQPITLKNLSLKLNISERSVRYTIDQIDDLLTSRKMKKLVRKPNVGVTFDVSMTAEALSGLLESDGGQGLWIPTSEERQLLIVSKLIASSGFVRINDLAEALAVSRTTVIGDLRLLRGWLVGEGLQLTAMASRGLLLNGDERRIRAMIGKLIKEDINISAAILETNDCLSTSVQHPEIWGGLAETSVQPIREGLQMIETCLDVTFSDETFLELLLQMTIAMYRVRLKRQIAMPEFDLIKMESTSEFIVVEEIVKMLGKRYAIHVPRSEVAHFTELVMGGNLLNHHDNHDDNPIELELLAYHLISNVSRHYPCNLDYDRLLVEGLMKHLKPTVFRLVHGIPVRNPLMEEIRKDYHDLFYLLQKELQPIEEYTNKVLLDEEIGFFVIHFAAALERAVHQQSRILNVLIVCATGRGTAELLSTKIKNRFKVNIVGCAACHQVDNLLAYAEVDLIVSTVALPEYEHILVGSLLLEKDLDKLARYLPPGTSASSAVSHDVNATARGVQQEQLLAVMLERIPKYCHVTDTTGLEVELRGLLGLGSPQCSAGDITLADLLTDQMISLDVEVADWKEAIVSAGELLLFQGCIEKIYIEEMQKTVENLGPYIVICPGVALPHGRKDKGVVSVGLSLVRLKHPVCFGHPENDPVDLVFAMATKDKTSHVLALRQLAALLDDERGVMGLRTAKTVGQVIEIIQAPNRHT